jgi:hypothetical protein
MMSEIIYDFRTIGATLRKRRLDDWWQPAKPGPEPKSAEPRLDQKEVWRRCIEKFVDHCFCGGARA